MFHKKEEDSKIPMIVFGVIVVILIIVILVFYFTNRNTLGEMDIHMPSENTLIGMEDFVSTSDSKFIEYSYTNFAWSSTYYGELVMKNGDVYSFNCNDDRNLNPNNCLIKKFDSISTNDMNKIEIALEKVQGNFEVKNEMNDFGQVNISIVKDGEEIVLIGKGDNKITNDSEGVKEILKILKKYNIYV